MKKVYYKVKKYILTDPLRTSVFLFLVCLLFTIIITLLTTKNGYSKEFYENILVEAHGMLFDILILGILLYWMNKYGEKHRDINKLKDELSYYLEYTDPEATFHVSKIIRQLNKLGVYDFNLVRIYLEDASLLGIYFENTNFMGNWLSRAFFHVGEFVKCSFVKTECIMTNFTEAELTDCQFIECKLEGSDFSDANLNTVAFKDCDMNIAVFSNSSLFYCSFQNSIVNVDFDNAVLIKCDLTTYGSIANSNFNGATLQNCKILRKDINLFTGAKLVDNEIV